MGLKGALIASSELFLNDVCEIVNGGPRYTDPVNGGSEEECSVDKISCSSVEV